MTKTPQNGIPNRIVGLAIVIVFHIFLIYILQSGLGSQVIEVIKGPVETRVIEEVKEQKEAPPPPPPKFVAPPPFVPPPDINIVMPVETGPSTAIQSTTSAVPQKAKPAAPVIETRAKADPRHPNSRPAYPPTSRRLEEQGTVVLVLYVQEDGRVGDAKVQKSSGYPRLDDAAVLEAKRSWRFIPAMSGGKPIASWHPVAVTFRLEQ